MNDADPQHRSRPDTPSSAESFVRELARRAAAARHRHLVVLSGTQEWTTATTLSLSRAFVPGRRLWVGDAPPADMESLAPKKARAELGRECDLLVFDARNDLDPDAFGATSGTVRSGGLLLLLTPELDAWPRLASRDSTHRTGRFIRRLVRLLTSDPDVFMMTPDAPVPTRDLPPWRPMPVTDAEGPCHSGDQCRAVEAVMHVVEGQRRRPAVLFSDRGRGKSAAFGIAAGRLMQAGTADIIVTAPRYAAVEGVFEHACRLIPECHCQEGRVETATARMTFMAPDELLRLAPPADLVLVDEAAAIPTPMLEGLLARYPRIAFATTVHGYEGTGRGFSLRFRDHLQSHSRGWTALELHEPIRWAPEDPLERIVFRALALDAEPAPASAVAGALPATCRVERLDRDTLAADEETLRELFGLLVLAHYRTRPQDLLHLLDGPGLAVYAMRHAGHTVAVALLAFEGGLDPDMARAVWKGTRRPRGHLVPEALSAHLGLDEAARRTCARVVRIAVHPNLQHRGLGTALLEHLTGDVRMQGVDYLGTSFGATPELIAFWSHSGWLPARVSVTAGAASGERSVLLVRGLSDKGIGLAALAHERFRRQFPAQLCGPLRMLPPDRVLPLWRAGPPPAAGGILGRLDTQDWRDLLVFAYAHRPYEGCIEALRGLALAGLADPRRSDRLEAVERDALILKPLQHRDWQEVAASLGLPGRDAVVLTLRRACRSLLEACAPHALPAGLQDELTRLAAERG